MKDAEIQRVRERFVVADRKARRQQRGRHALKHQAHARDPEQHRADIPDADALSLRRRQQARTQPQPPGHQQAQQRRHRHDSEAADLNQRQDHRLPETGPMRRGINDHQPSHADRARGRKQRLHKRRASDPAARERQQKQQRADQHRCCKTRDHSLCRMTQQRRAPNPPSALRTRVAGLLHGGDHTDVRTAASAAPAAAATDHHG